MRRVLHLNVALASLAFAACVTINVYFPAAAAEQAAGQIIDTVTRSGSGTTGSAAPPAATPQAAPAPQQQPPPRSDASAFAAGADALLLAAGQVLERLVPAAHAQANANIDISSPEIRAVTGSMQARFAQLEKYFGAGVLGLTADGLIEVRDQGAVPLAERAIVKRLVAEDNQDRNTLYAEIAKANGHPEWEADIRRIFARRWVERGAQPGWYYQDASGAWKQK
ncbi:MAG: YdbL family protein [Steroidobacteraceae bacterium]